MTLRMCYLSPAILPQYEYESNPFIQPSPNVSTKSPPTNLAKSYLITPDIPQPLCILCLAADAGGNDRQQRQHHQVEPTLQVLLHDQPH